MGRNKGNTRTKGNSHPSSSCNSASLLTQDGRHGFVGFNTGKVNPDVDCHVDSMFSMVMKRMVKRDAATRLKGIQDYKDLCLEKDKETLKGILPFWPRLYNKLSLDDDRRIRESTQAVNGMLFEKMNRDMAPYLKSIMGAWLLGRCDPFAPAALAAETAFTTAFPANKQTEVIMFCKDEIFLFFQENLHQQMPKTSKDKNKEEDSAAIENRLAFLIGSSLRGLTLFVISITEKSCLAEKLKDFVSENKFWKIFNSKHSKVIASWYQLVGTLCTNLPEILQPYDNQIARHIVHHLTSNNPAIAVAVWEAMLSFLSSFNMFEKTDVKKMFLSQLWAILKDGAQGKATILYPSLLVLLSKLPEEVSENDFYSSFFTHISESLFLNSVKTSGHECSAIVSCYVDCLQYVTQKLLSTDDSLVERLFNQLLWLIEQSLKPNGAHLPVSDFYPRLGLFIYTLEQTENGNSNADKLKNIISHFWTEALNICSNALNMEGDSLTISSLAYFFHCILQPSNPTEMENDGASKLPALTTESVASKKESTHLLLNRPFLQKLTVNVCSLLCEKLDHTSNSNYLKLLVEILTLAHSCKFFHDILKESGISVDDFNEAPNTFHESFILKWVASPSAINIDNIVDLISMVCSCVESDSAVHILTRSCNLKCLELPLKVIKRVVLSAHDEETLKMFQEGFSYSTFIDLLEKLIGCQNYDTSQILSYCEILKKFLAFILTRESYTPNHAEELLKKIDSYLKLFLNKPTRGESHLEEDLLEFLCDVTESIISSKQASSVSNEELMITIFELGFNEHCEDVEKKTKKLWENYLTEVLFEKKHLKKKFFLHVTSKLHNLLFTQTAESSKYLLNVNLTLLSNFTGKHSESSAISTDTLFSYFFNAILPNPEEWSGLQEGLRLDLMPSLFKMKLFYSSSITVLATGPLTQTHFQFLSAAQTVIKLILSWFKTFESKEIEMTENIFNIVSAQLAFLQWASIYSRRISHGNVDSKDDLLTSDLSENCIKVTSLLPKPKALAFLEQLCQMCILDESHWVLVLQEASEALMAIFPDDTINLLESKVFEENVMEMEMLPQIIIPHLPSKTKTKLVQQFTSKLGSIPEDLSILAKICCCFQDSDVLCSTDIQNTVTYILKKVIYFDGELEDNQDNHCFLLSQVACLLTKVSRTAPKIVFSIFDSILYFGSTALYNCCEVAESVFQSTSKMSLAYQTFSFLQAFLLKFKESHSDEVDHFLNQTSDTMADLYIQTSSAFHQLKDLPEFSEDLLIVVSEVIEVWPADLLLKSLMFLSPQTHATNTEKQINFVLEKLLTSLCSNTCSLQLSAYNMLIRLMPLIYLLLKEYETTQEAEQDELIWKLQPFIESIQNNTKIVQDMLFNLRIKDRCVVLPFTDSYAYTAAYLYSWKVLLDFFDASTPQEFSCWILKLEELNLFSEFLNNIFRLMPENPATCYITSKGSNFTMNDTESKIAFMNFLQPAYKDLPTSEYLQLLACNLFYNVLRKAPASVRIWWNNLDKHDAPAVDSFTSKYVSSILSDKEFQIVQESQLQFDNMTINSRPATREIIAIYILDSSRIELMIKLPNNYPLGSIAIEKRGDVGISQPKWRHMLMQLTSFLTYQNGSVLDGLLLWKKNLDKKFEGLEECPICFFILHTITEKLPNLLCRTCKKKFHSNCLHKWFVTSNNSTCPLCRNLF